MIPLQTKKQVVLQSQSSILHQETLNVGKREKEKSSNLRKSASAFVSSSAPLSHRLQYHRPQCPRSRQFHLPLQLLLLSIQFRFLLRTEDFIIFIVIFSSSPPFPSVSSNSSPPCCSSASISN